MCDMQHVYVVVCANVCSLRIGYVAASTIAIASLTATAVLPSAVALSLLLVLVSMAMKSSVYWLSLASLNSSLSCAVIDCCAEQPEIEIQS
jgi:hypothetical protein